MEANGQPVVLPADLLAMLRVDTDEDGSELYFSTPNGTRVFLCV